LRGRRGEQPPERCWRHLASAEAQSSPKLDWKRDSLVSCEAPGGSIHSCATACRESTLRQVLPTGRALRVTCCYADFPVPASTTTTVELHRNICHRHEHAIVSILLSSATSPVANPASARTCGPHCTMAGRFVRASKYRESLAGFPPPWPSRSCRESSADSLHLAARRARLRQVDEKGILLRQPPH